TLRGVPRCRRRGARRRRARPVPASARPSELDYAGVVVTLAVEPRHELRRRRRVNGQRHERLSAARAARNGHAGDVDPRLTEKRSDAADNAGDVVVETEDEERRELQLDLETEDVDEPRAV